MKHEALIQAVRERNGRGLKFGEGIWTADRYARTVQECIGVGMCQRYFGNGKSYDAAVKDAAGILSFAGANLQIEEKLATGRTSIKSLLGDIELPDHTLMAFTHVLTTSREDRDGDILETKGAKPDANMPLLWQHVHTLPLGKSLKVLEHSDDVLRLATVLLDLNELTEDAGKLIEAKALRFSHGFRALEFSERDKASGGPGFRVKSFEIMEASLVSVPSNIDAQLELFSRKQLKSEVFKAHSKHLWTTLRQKKRSVPGITMKFGSVQQLKDAADQGLVKTLKDQGVTVIDAGGDGRDASTHPTGILITENGDEPHEHKAGQCGCQKAAGEAEESNKAPMARDEFDNQTDAESRSGVLGCLLHHQVVGAGGRIVYKPCRDPEEYSHYTAKPGSLPKPAASAKPAEKAYDGQKVWLDGSSLKGSYLYRLQKLSADANRHLTANGIDMGRKSASVFSLFDGYGILCVHDGGHYYESSPSVADVGDYYRADWTETDGDPKWSGNVQMVEVAASIDIREAATKAIESLQAFVKAGRTLSTANEGKLQAVMDDLAELVSGDLSRSATAVVERCQRVLEEVLSSARPVVDEDPQPKAGSPLTDQHAAEIILISRDIDLIRKTHQALGAVLAVDFADRKANDLKKLLRRA